MSIVNDKVLLNNGDLVFLNIWRIDSKICLWKSQIPGNIHLQQYVLKKVLDIAGGFDDPFFEKQ